MKNRMLGFPPRYVRRKCSAIVVADEVVCFADLPTFSPRGVSLDVSDEMGTTRRQCKHLLNRLFAMVGSTRAPRILK